MHAHISQGSTKGAAITQLGHGIQRAAGLRCHFGCAFGIQPRRAVILDVHSGSSPSELSFWMRHRQSTKGATVTSDARFRELLHCHFGHSTPHSRLRDSCATVPRHFRDTSVTPPRRRAPELEHLRNSQSQRLTDNKRAHWTHRFAGTRLHSPARFESQLLKRFCTELAEQPKV